MRKRNSLPCPEYLFIFEHVLHILIILDRFMMEYCTCERGKLLLLVHLVLCIALTVYLHLISRPVLLDDPRLLSGVEANAVGLSIRNMIRPGMVSIPPLKWSALLMYQEQ
jgi:hypothetical protein